MPIPPDGPLRLAIDVSLAPTEHGSVLLDGRRGTYWELNAAATTAALLWRDGASLTDAVTAVTERFDVPADTARRDLVNLVTELREHGLLQ